MLTVVVPSYNEGGNVRNLVCQIDIALEDIEHEILFVDDSTDDTPQIIEKTASEFESVRMIHRDNEKGLATAVLLGFKEAKGDVLACIDADLQHPPITLKYMYHAIKEGADICVPSRYLPGGSDGGLDSYRKFVSWTARKMGQVLLPPLKKLSDPTSGLFMLKKKVIENADLRPVGWKIMIEVVAMGDFDTLIEIPYRFSERLSGESKLSKDATMEYIKQIKDLSKRYNKGNRFRVIRWSYAKMVYAAGEEAKPVR